MARRLGTDVDRSTCRPPPTSAAMPSSHFRANGGGRIVNVASRAAFRGDSPSHWHYAASKSAMIGMTKTIARGYAAENILAFAVAPGFTVTDATEEYLEGRGGAQILADIPLGPRDQHRPKSPKRSAGWPPMRPPPRPGRSSTSMEPAMFARAALAPSCCRHCRSAALHPAGQGAAPDRAAQSADRGVGTAMGGGLRRLDRLGQAGPAGPDPRQHLSGRHLRHLRDPDRRQKTAMC